MPNHITTIIRLKPEHVDSLGGPPTREMLEAHEKEWDSIREGWAKREPEKSPQELVEAHPTPPYPEFVVDFGRLIPEPANIEKGGCSGRHEPGVVCWYSWNTENWGTKWNGYDAERVDTADGQVFVKFDTAWSHPFPVIRALSLKFPEHTFEVAFADEDLGYNLGAYRVLNGDLVQHVDIEYGTDLARGIASIIKYGQSYDEMRRSNACENFEPHPEWTPEDGEEENDCKNCWENKKWHEPPAPDQPKALITSAADLFSSMTGEAPAA